MFKYRKLPHKNDYLILVVLGIMSLFLFSLELLICLFFLAVSMAFTESYLYRAIFSIGFTALFVFLNKFTYSLYFFLMLPTLIHVLVFTFIFVLLGALRTRSIYGFLTTLAIVLVSFSFFINFSTPSFTSLYAKQNIVLLEGVYNAFFNMSGLDMEYEHINKILSFFGFCYMYHYLNWFSKTGVIGWNKISANRVILIAILYIISISIYLYDYELGLTVLLLLSFLHVVLEFPLNGLSVLSVVKFLKIRH